MKLLVIDGNSIVNRAFYGIKLLSNKKGMYTNAITGFFNILTKLTKGFSPDGIAVAFDLKAPTFRHLKYDAYKAGRKSMPDELHMQMPYVKEILRAMNIPVLEAEGWEADDILGTLAHAADVSGNTCIIATGDRDSFQLITENVSVNLASMKEDIFYTPEKINEVYGVTPRQMIEVKALMGDSSDNIPGVAGIGEKTALSLIQKYGSIDEIYSKLDSLELTKSVREKLTKGEEMCRLSHFLGTIATNAPVSLNLSDYAVQKPDEAKLLALLTELEMFAMIKKLGFSDGAKKEAAEAMARSAAADIKKEKKHYPLADADDIILFEGELYAFREGVRLDTSDAAAYLSSDVPKRTFDAKALHSYAFGINAEIRNIVFDSTLAAYLLNVNANEYTLERLCAEYGVVYSGKDELAKSLYLLCRALWQEINEQEMLFVLTDIEIPLSLVLVSMEKYGVQLNIDGVRRFGEELDGSIDAMKSQIFEYAGEEFNILSPKQLAHILFEKLGLPSGKKTKTGYSTNADVLEFLMDKHPIVPLVSEYRTLTKLSSTYVQGLLKQVADDGRIHTTFRQTETRTGRISSTEPNIQNIPVRTELGKQMRKFFTAKEGYVLVDADYSQIELRVLAHISGDETMRNAFVNGDDIHTITASQVFNQPPEWVTPQMRSSAKAVNFGIIYGISAFSLSKDIGVSVAEANEYIKAYLSKYPEIDRYMSRTVEDAKKNGTVTTLFGRRRTIPEILATNKLVQALGTRIARNTPIQGTAADIIKIAMVRVYERLRRENPDSRLILQVHDELIVEAKPEDVPTVEKILREEMENAAKLTVPLTVDVQSGQTWFDTH